MLYETFQNFTFVIIHVDTYLNNLFFIVLNYIVLQFINVFIKGNFPNICKIF